MVTIAELQKEIRDLAKKVATQESLEELKQIISSQTELINHLQGRVATLEEDLTRLQTSQDENDQYIRRNNLRIIGLPSTTKENADDCLDKITKIFRDAAVELPALAIDRAHRIGKGSMQKPPQVIVKFTTWRDRTAVYRARRVIKQNHGISIQPDLTKARLQLLKSAQSLCLQSSDGQYAFADVNCRLGIKLRQGGLKFFASIKEAKEILRVED